MTTPGDLIVAVDFTAIASLFGLGLFCIISKTNLIKMVIGIELMGKAVTLSFILGGFLNGNVGLSQGVVFTIIAIEAVVAALALALALLGRGAFNTLDVEKINEISAKEARRE